MDIKEVEHLDVYKQNINLMQYSKNYKKLGNKILHFYNQRLNEKYDYLNRIKDNNSKLAYFKEFQKVKKHDKMRLMKIKRTEPFPLFSSKNIKKVYAFKQFKALKVKLKNNINFNYNKILYVNKIYAKLKKKSKYTFKLKFHLWKTLKKINYNNPINYFKGLPINLDYQLQFLNITKNNYLLQNKLKLRKNIFYTIFKNFSNVILKSIYKVKFNNKFLNFYQSHFLDNLFYIYINLKKIIINNYYNKYFLINYNLFFNYYNNFYDFLNLKILNNISVQLKKKNYYNIFCYKLKNITNNFSIYKILIFFNYKKYKKNFKNNFFLNTFYKRVKNITIKLMKEKKWTKHAMTKINTKFLKKLVINNTKLNMYVNDKSMVFNKDLKAKLLLTSTVFKEGQYPVKIRKYNIYFFNFLKKFAMLQQRLIKKKQKYNYYIAKKYDFLITFFNYYFKQLFNCLKHIFYSNLNILYLHILKLKFLLVYLYYKIFLFFIKTLNSKIKKKKKLIYSNKTFTFNLLLYYKKAFKKWFYNKKKEWYIKKEKKVNDIDKIDKYSQPINIFKYNPLLNPRHNLWAARKIQKQKRIFRVIKYKMNGYLRWFKWETKRRLRYKYRLKLIKIKQKKRMMMIKKKKKKKKRYKFLSLKYLRKKKKKKLNKLIKKTKKIWKVKTKIKKKYILKKFEKNFKFGLNLKYLKKKKKKYLKTKRIKK